MLRIKNILKISTDFFLKNLYKSVSSVLSVFFLTACIYDNLADCPQGINIRLFEKTACAADTVFPQMDGVQLFVFDRNDKLVSAFSADNKINTGSFQQTVSAKDGIFSVVACGGTSFDKFEIPQIKNGETSKRDLLFRLRRTAQQAVSIDGMRVFYGESQIVFLPNPAEYGSTFENSAINLQEITNRFTVQVEGLPQTDDYEIKIESANGAMNFDGTTVDDEIIAYRAQTTFVDSILQAKFTILKLAFGCNTLLIIRDKRADKELYRGDLLGTLLLKNPNVNPACDHDFTIRFTTRDQCECGTYMIAEIWVNNWLVHSYESEL